MLPDIVIDKRLNFETHFSKLCEKAVIVIYNLRNNNEFELPRVKTTSYGSEKIKYRGLRFWLFLPQRIRDAQSINEFKKEIKS